MKHRQGSLSSTLPAGTLLQRQGHFGVFPAGSYLGIDRSEQALRIAERELTGLNCSVELVEADFVLFIPRT
jgi:hypothetical protein